MLNIAVANDENGPMSAPSSGKKPVGAAGGLGGKGKGLGGAPSGLGGSKLGKGAGKEPAEAKPRRALGDISNRSKGLGGVESGKPAAQKVAAASSSSAAAPPVVEELPPIERFFPRGPEPALPSYDRSGIVPEEYVEAACLARSRRPAVGARTPSRTSAALSPSATPSRAAGLIEVGPTPGRPRLLADALDAAGVWTEEEQLEAALAISLSDFTSAGGNSDDSFDLGGLGLEFGHGLSALNLADEAEEALNLAEEVEEAEATLWEADDEEEDSSGLPPSPLLQGSRNDASTLLPMRPPAAPVQAGPMASMAAFQVFQEEKRD